MKITYQSFKKIMKKEINIEKLNILKNIPKNYFLNRLNIIKSIKDICSLFINLTFKLLKKKFSQFFLYIIS